VFDSLAVSVLFTAVFAVTGTYALLRWASLRLAVAGRAGDEVAELTHLLMSVAMLAMTWGYATPASDIAQLVLFGVLGGYFLVRMSTDRLFTSACACAAPGYHLLMCAAMGWMVVAMPWLMGSAANSGDQAPMQMDGMSMPMPEQTHGAHSAGPSFAVPATVLLALALIGAAGYWAFRLIRLRPSSAPAVSEPPAPRPSTAASGAGTLTATTHVVKERRGPVSDRLLDLLTPRADALCHVLMSVSMAAMLLLMI
jgi:hypothetical protein